MIELNSFTKLKIPSVRGVNILLLVTTSYINILRPFHVSGFGSYIVPELE